MTRKQRRLALIGSAGGGARRRALGLVLCRACATRSCSSAPRARSRPGVAARHALPPRRARRDGLGLRGARPGRRVRGDGRQRDRAGALSRPPAGPVPRRAGRRDGGRARRPSGVFVADTVLAKHDETYMPREVADALKEQGVWKRRGQGARQAGPPRDQGPPMIVEAGHFALALALGLSLVAGDRCRSGARAPATRC